MSTEPPSQATPWDELVAAYTTLAQLRDETSDFLADLLELLTEYAGTRQDRLGRVVTLRVVASDLLGQTEEALAELEQAIHALEPPDPDAPAGEA